jgi:hypothetical protein
MSQTRGESNITTIYRTPRWVKIFGIVVVALIVLFVVVQIISGGNHGPGQHLPSHNAVINTPASSITEGPTAPTIQHGQ